MAVKIEKLLEPGYIGRVKTRNRMIKSSSSSSGMWDLAKKALKPEALAWYEEIARGGVGAIFVGCAGWKKGFPGRPFQTDENITLERTIVDRIHKHGCPAFLQFGDADNLVPLPGYKSRAASAVNYPTKLDMNNILPREMTLDEIREEQNTFVSAVVRAQRAGYDGVEINAACSHVFSTFLSRFWNKRKDEYGPQNMEN